MSTTETIPTPPKTAAGGAPVTSSPGPTADSMRIDLRIPGTGRADATAASPAQLRDSIKVSPGGDNAPAAAPAERGVIRGDHQAIVIVERRFGRSEDTRLEPMPPGWNWTLGNARVGQLYDRLFADARLTWSSLVIPEEQEATFADLGAPVASQRPLTPYDGTLKIEKTSLTSGPETGEPLYLIFNGHRFPICDLNHAILVHRQNKCDATLIDFPRINKRAYDEKLQIDDKGAVHRVNRSYGHGERASLQSERDWPVMIVLSSAAMKQLIDVAMPHRISQWPGALLRGNLSLKGSTIPGSSFSLNDRDHLYELNEVLLRLKPHWLAEAGQLVDQGGKIWVGSNVRIDSSANVIGPVAIGDNVEIGPDAVIVGPTTIGHGSKIGAGMVLKRSVVLPNTTLASATIEGRSLSHAIVLGGDQPTLQAITTDGEGEFRALSIDRPIKLETVLEGGAVKSLTGMRYTVFQVSKRALDIAGSIIGLIFTAPLFPIIALAIKFNSPGRVFYAHVRQGRGGKNFRCYKFRTMVPNAEEIKRKLMSQNQVDGPQFKMKDDPRIFFVGRWLRKLNADEFPQFWNVLLGQMSLVGPRPSPERENQMCPAWREARLSVRPGITGLWQVSRRRDRDETDFQEWIYYDVQYIKKQSIWLDMKIILKTFLVALHGGQ